ncbi:hypothetical protein [Rhizobium phage RHph_N46]|nr:hypothetical protein [Rhizobium phage RHph_N46]
MSNVHPAITELQEATYRDIEWLGKPMNRETYNQLFGVILLDCITQCNEAKLPEDEYNIKLRAMLKERTSVIGQRELEV